MYRSPHGGGDGGAAAREAKRRKGSVTVHVPGEMKAVLHVAAAREQRSVSAIASEAIHGWLLAWVARLKETTNAP